ncbi:interleukin-17 receptor E isoform X2 [Nannospalax galili]|uniref:interleukin-17 receptor E isoform X2 n=1 Tax=Nannospalax galili TaxID=1026970 RepID=UPI000819B95A|nr:interleukin-17 receptor E isoform X2 [Nannospalax galili]
MGRCRLAVLLLPLFLPHISLSVSAEIGCPNLPRWISRRLLAFHVDKSFTGSSTQIPYHTLLSTKPWHAQVWHWSYCLCLRLVSHPSGLQWGWFHFLMQKFKNSCKFKFYWRHRMPASPQRNLLGSSSLSQESHHISIPSPAISHKGLRSKRTQPSAPHQEYLLRAGPEFSFNLLPEARAIQVTVPPGSEASVRLCYQWALECEEMNNPFDAQKIVSGGHTADLPYEFLLPCLCIEASYLQEDTVRRKKCPFQNWPEAYGSDFWKSAHFTDYSQHSQMIMALTLRCPLKLEASLCQRRDPLGSCEDLPNATAQESEGWYVLEKVDLHPQLCFKFSFENNSHVECPHQSESFISWNVSMETEAEQLILHFSSRMYATFSAAWSHPDLGPDTLMPPVYSVSQTQGLVPVTLDLIIPFPRPGGCILARDCTRHKTGAGGIPKPGGFLSPLLGLIHSLGGGDALAHMGRDSCPQVWRSDVQFAWKHLLCPDVSHRHLGLLTLALLCLTTLLGVVLVLTCRRLLSGPGRVRPVLLLHTADSEAQRRLVGALAELLRTALGGRRDVIVDLWEGTHVARVGPLPWLWAARERVARERGTMLLLWSSADRSASRGHDPHVAPLRALLCAGPRPLLLLVYFGRLCAKGDIPRPLRALPRYRLLRDLPRLLRALGATSWSCLGAKQSLQDRLELCHQLELEAAKLVYPCSADPHCGSDALQD